jgi:hypothetical protein
MVSHVLSGGNFVLTNDVDVGTAVARVSRNPTS